MPQNDPPNHLPDEATAADSTLARTMSLDAADSAERVIGRYHLVRRLGVGGMGEVWLAEQKEPVRRRVALKLIRAGMSTREAIARFNSERQALALMDHPAIAKVFDADSTPEGAPYFVMEYVAGTPITDYCDNHRLSTRQRLELLTQVCEGVQHAHQKAIIHRDLKPSNILVAEVDGKPVPKIIDFGIAKALTQKLTMETMFTRAGELVGTREYMSPEQASSTGEDVDTRSDVYSLGIIFYELLAGAPPIELQRIALEEFLRRLRQDEPPKPSTRISRSDPATSTEVAHKRQTEPEALVRQLRGELDSIALKALEKERSRRYASASEFAGDIQRYLNNEPVLAVPPSVAYRARKFARRYRVPLITLGAFVLVLAVATGASIWQSIVARKQRDRADAEAAVAKAVNQFLQDDLLSQANPESQNSGQSKIDPDVKVRSLLDRAADRAGKRFAQQPLVESEIQSTIGKAYMGLGLNKEAEQRFRRAYELSAANRGADDPRTLDFLMLLSEAAINLDENDAAIAAAKTVFEAESRTLGPENPQTVVAMQNLASLYFQSGKYAEAELLAKKALDVQTRRLGYDNIDTLNSSDTLAALYITESRYAEAHALLAKGLESYQRLYGPDHPFTNREMFGLAKVMFGEGDYAPAEKLFAQVQAAYERAYGARHVNTLRAESYLGQDYVEEGKTAEGISLLEKTVNDMHAVAGPSPGDIYRVEAALGWAYDSAGELGRAEQIWQDVLRGFRRLDGFESDVADLSELLGQNLTKQHKYQQAEVLLRQALAIREKRNHDDWGLYRAQAFLGASLAGLRRYAEAEPLLLKGYEGMQERASRMPARQKKWIRSAGEQIVGLYSQWSKPEQAAQWRARLQAP
ncbi:MAG TPA: serine/threonine-protein kinase [Candidatus Binatia bacterium]|nr:serine/threonine-protein kinase [Candidatus Binatia bacterium]